jgi:hypothetical protein
MKIYQIYDGENNSLFADCPLVEGKTGKDAILKYLEKTNRKYKLKRSSGNNVIFRATGVIQEGERLIRNGNDIWYAKN